MLGIGDSVKVLPGAKNAGEGFVQPGCVGLIGTVVSISPNGSVCVHFEPPFSSTSATHSFQFIYEAYLAPVGATTAEDYLRMAGLVDD